jgi:hypothetical protein
VRERVSWLRAGCTLAPSDQEQSCRKSKPWSAYEEIGGRGRLPAHRLENSSGRRWSTSARANTVPGLQSKLSRSGYPRRAERELICIRQTEERPRPGRVSVPHATMLSDTAPLRDDGLPQPSVRELPCTHYNERGQIPPIPKRWPLRRDPQLASAQLPNAPMQQLERPPPKDLLVDLLLLARQRIRAVEG